MSEPVRLGWQLTLVNADQLITHPEPYYAHTEAHLEWYLRNYGPAEKYVITRVPDPLRPEARAKIEQMQAEAAQARNTP